MIKGHDCGMQSTRWPRGKALERCCQVRKWGGHPGEPGATRTQWLIPQGPFPSDQTTFSSNGVGVLSFFPLPCLFLSHPPSISNHLSLSLLWNCSSPRLSPQDREHDWKPPWDYNLSTEAKSAFTILGKRLFNLYLCIGQITKVWEGFIIRIEPNVKDSRDCYQNSRQHSHYCELASTQIWTLGRSTIFISRFKFCLS